MAAKKLNILHLDTEKYWRGGQQQVFYLHKLLVKKSIKSILVCNKSSELKKKCINEKLPYYEVNMRAEIDILSAYQIYKLCKKEKITIIHAHSAHALSIGLLIKLFSSSLILVGVRRVDFQIKKNLLSQIKYNSKKINKIVCISDFIKKVMIEDGIKEENLVTIRSGADIHKFDDVFPDNNLKDTLGISSNQIVLGTVAAFAGHKDYPNLLNAFRLVKDKIANVKLCVVGDGQLKPEMEQLAQDLQVDDHVIFTGFRENVGRYLKTFDIFVLASKKEGLGTSIIDALSVGLPVIATRTGGIIEVIENDVNGILVEPKNSDLLAETIIELIEDKEKRNRLSCEAIASAQNFSIENNVEKNISLYRDMMNNYGNYE